MAPGFFCGEPSRSTSTSQPFTTCTAEIRVGGDAVFESCDGTRLPFSLSLLAELSSFFRDLTSLPPPSDDADGIPAYALPSASAAGLRYTFDLVLALTQGRSPLPFECAPYEDVLIIADAYDLPLVSNWLTLQSALLLDKDPFVPYTIASITGDRKIADQAIRKAIGRDVSRMPGWANTILKRHAPLALIRLYELSSEHAAAMEAFGRKIRVGDPDQDFAETCKGGEGCLMFRLSGGNWAELKGKCAETLVQSFTRHVGRGMDPAPLKDVTLALAWCGRCQMTLEKSCMSAWRDTLGDLGVSATA